MKSLGFGCVDYWQDFLVAERGLKNRFGVRVRDGKCWALIQIGDDEPTTFGVPHEIPVDLSNEHRLVDPNSDLLDVLAGSHV